jgi:hypothetical protein
MIGLKVNAQNAKALMVCQAEMLDRPLSPREKVSCRYRAYPLAIVAGFVVSSDDATFKPQ